MRAAKPGVAAGLMELMSTTSLPGDSPSTTPAGPNSAASTSGVSGTMRMTTSDACATERASGSTVAAARTRG